jgi:ABC-type multidrug transport system fused ATPase/permease subunit
VRLWRDIGGLLKEFWTAHPPASLGLLAFLAGGNAREGLALLAMGGLVDALVGGASQSALVWAAVYVGAEALEQVYWPVKNALTYLLLDHSAYSIQRRVLERAAAAPLVRFDEGEFFDHLQRASAGMGDRLARASWGIVDGVQVLAMLGGVALALLAVHPILPLLLAAGTLPAVWLQLRVASAAYRAQRAHTTRDQVRQHLQRLLTGREAAAEIRLFGAAGYLLERWRRLRAERAGDLLAAERRRALFTTTGSLASAAAYAAALVFVAALILRGQLSLGGYVAVAAGALSLQSLLGAAISVFRSLEEESQFLGDLFDFWRVAQVEATSRRPGGEERAGGEASASSLPDGPVPLKPDRRAVAIEAEGLTFTYPGAARPVICGVDLRIGPGERVALVGENGAGKTTLVKLLIGLYQPDAGVVRLDGEALTAARAREARRRIAAVFQDHAAFQLTVRENVGLGDLTRLHDDVALVAALERAGLAAVDSTLPRRLDAYLGRQFGETELSGGQWQRVALARAFVRDADLLVLDEPTAALDPLAELALFERFAELAGDRTALMVSHRLGMARLADRILVLRGGRLVEAGPHAALVAQGGEYAALFAAQAQWYR